MEDTKFPESEELDALMRDFLAAELNPQLGRAAQHFRRHLHGSGSSAGAGAAPPGPFGPRRALSGWIVGIVGGAMAASIAALWARPVIWPAPPPRPTNTVQVLPVADYHFDLDDVTLSTKTRDGGTVLLDGRTPARRIFRDELRQSRWVDPRHDASVEQIEPSRNVMLIEMDTY